MRAPLIRLSCLLSLLIASPSSAVTMAWTPIGAPGNACDPNTTLGGCYGAVGYNYSIGTYEVTNAQYAEFLNAKAASDPFGLYNFNMSTPDPRLDHQGGITRSGSSGSYTYSVISGRGDMPVNWVSALDALRFANWLNNGQGSGDTETGAYTMSNGPTVTRNAGATIVLASEDEWYKAAYYGASSTSYFDYPTGSDAQPICSTPTAAANRANCSGAVGDLTIKGSYTGSSSPYGTFDQAGNVEEWNEAIYPGGTSRGLRGGAFDCVADCPASPNRGFSGYYNEYNDLGFRVAMIPEPGTGLLVIAGLLGLAGWRRPLA